MAWSVPATFTVGQIVTADDMNLVRDNFRFLKGIDGTISLDAPIKGGTGAGTFYMEYEALVSASVVAIASATAGRIIYSSADRTFVYTDGTAHRSIPGVPRTGTIGQLVVGVGSGTFGLGAAPASADANKAWVTLGSASTGTWAAVSLGVQRLILTGLGTFRDNSNSWVTVTGYSGSLTFTGSRTVMVMAQHNAVGVVSSGGGDAAQVRILIDSTKIGGIANNGNIAAQGKGPVAVFGIGTAGSGDHTFALQILGTVGTAAWGTAGSGTDGATAGLFGVVAWS